MGVMDSQRSTLVTRFVSSKIICLAKYVGEFLAFAPSSAIPEPDDSNFLLRATFQPVFAGKETDYAYVSSHMELPWL